ncbi:MAG: hypothetical protein EAZ92_09515 [Candidatus Kapaibacterium sp.]|nr:MAG: hypothetical protein EAZ92_09515 [Candidatus Kapabacteria bacterium]
MKRETLLTLAVAALLVLNLGMMAYLFISRRSPEEREGMPQQGRRIDELIMTRLRLNEAQVEQFKALKSGHRSVLDSLDSTYRGILAQYFQLAPGAKIDTVLRDSLQRRLENLHGQKIIATGRHFADIKNICSPKQQSLFEELLPELSRMMLQPPRPRRREGE